MIATLLLWMYVAQGFSPASWSDIVARLDKGAATSDAALLRSAIAGAETLADITGQDHERELALQGAAYGAWRLCTVPNLPAGEAATLLKSAEKNLRAVIKMNPKSGEAYALLASVDGQMIRFSNGRDKMTLGPDAEANRAAAMTLEPNNPRVVLQSAISLYNT